MEKNFCSTTEVAEKWGISARRIAMLAAEGRIEGAIYVGKSWMIPADAAKPESKKTRNREKKSDSTRYIFPGPNNLTTAGNETVGRYTGEEKALRRAYTLYEQGDLARSRDIAEGLLKSSNKYIRLGASYDLIYACISLRDFETAKRNLMAFQLTAAEPDAHSEELSAILDELTIAFNGGTALARDFRVPFGHTCSEESIPYLMTLSAFADTVCALVYGEHVNHSMYELLCTSCERQGDYFTAAYLHFYLHLMYAGCDDEAAFFHLHRAVDIAAENNSFTSIVRFFAYDMDGYKKVLKDYPKEIGEKLLEKSLHELSAYNDFLVYLGKTGLFASLTKEELCYISYAVKSYTYEKIARLSGRSVSTVINHFSALYKKLGVKGKKELKELYVGALMDLKAIP